MGRPAWLVMAVLMSACSEALPPPPSPTASPSASAASSVVLPTPTRSPRGVVADIALAEPAYAAVIDTGRQRLFVRTSEHVVAIDANTLQTIATIPLAGGNHWTGLAFDEARGVVWATNFTGAVAMIGAGGATPELGATIPVELNVGPIAVDARTHFAYAVSIGREARTDSVPGMTTVINGNTRQVIARVPAHGYPMDVAANAVTGRVYVSVRAAEPNASSLVQILDGDSLRELATIGVSPLLHFALDTRRNRIYAVTAKPPAPAGAFLTAIDLRTAQASTFITFSGDPSALGVDASRGRLYLAARTGELVIANEREDLQLGFPNDAHYEIPAEPTGIAVDEAKHRVYIVSFTGHLTVLDDDGP